MHKLPLSAVKLCLLQKNYDQERIYKCETNEFKMENGIGVGVIGHHFRLGNFIGYTPYYF